MNAWTHLITKTAVNTGAFIYLWEEVATYSFMIADRTVSAYCVASATTKTEMFGCHSRYVVSLRLCHDVPLRAIP
jgi:hypothetical protein